MTFNIKNMKPQKNSPHEQGYYSVINTKKYIGDLTKVIYRSSYERIFYHSLDVDPSVIYWCVEPQQLRIRYWNPTKKRFSHYYPDAFCLKKVGDREVKCLIEIKPKSKLIKPKPPKVSDPKKNAQYLRRLSEYNVIDAKRKASVEYCKMKGMEYIFITERTVKPSKK
jgi:hypothetical protein